MVVAISAVPLAASTVQPSDIAEAPSEITAPIETVPAEAEPFASQFAEVIEPLGPDLEYIDLALPDTAVDLESFEPPVEQSPILRELGTGVASYYGRRFHGRRTANGERFNMRELTAAHKTLPFGTRVKVTNPSNGRSVTVRINDRGPYIRGRTIDLSRAAAEQIGMIARGHATVELALVE